MKIILRYAKQSLMIVLVGLLASCVDSSEQFKEVCESKWNKALLECDFNNFTDETRSRYMDLQEDDFIVVKFYDEDGSYTYGYATFSKETGNWNLNYSGILRECTSRRCEIYYIGNNAKLSSSQDYVSCDYLNPTYYDYGQYSVEKILTSTNGLVILVHLKGELDPLTSRVRFTSNSEKNITIKGFKYLTGLNFSVTYPYWNSTYGYIESQISSENDGKCRSPYFYVILDDGESYDHYVQQYMDYHIILKSGLNLYASKDEIAWDIYNEGTSLNITYPTENKKKWYEDTYRTISIPNFTIPAQDKEHWTEPKATFYSKVGLHSEFDFSVKTFGNANSWTDVFMVRISAYDSDGYIINNPTDFFALVDSSFGYNLVEAESEHFVVDYFEKDAEYYTIQFYAFDDYSFRITDFYISNFD